MKFALIGPTYPFRGGIAHYTTLLYTELVKEHNVRLISFKRQYPKLLFPGKTDREVGKVFIDTQAQYLLDPLSPITWWKTANYIVKWKPDIVILQWWVPFWAPAWFILTKLLKLRSQTRIVLLCHNILPHESGRLDRLLTKLALSQGDGFIVHAESEKSKLLSILPKKQALVTPLPTYNIFNKEGLTNKEARLKLGMDTNGPIILFFGFVRPYKGLDILINAIAELKDQIFLKLLVVGEFWMPKAPIEKQILQLGISDRVILIDKYIPNDNIAEYFIAADVVVLPYREATQSAVIQTAFGLGCPVITTDVGGLPEAVLDGVTGYIVPPENVQALVKALKRFFTENDAPVFIRNIHGSADRFAWCHMVRSIIKVSTLDALD